MSGRRGRLPHNSTPNRSSITQRSGASGGSRRTVDTSRSGQSRSLRGLFADGIWHCDCQPRLPAERFKVKKEGKNHGRWFYTCQQKQGSEKGCAFFLWDDDAKPREESAVLRGKRSEPINGNNVSRGTNGAIAQVGQASSTTPWNGATSRGQPAKTGQTSIEGQTSLPTSKKRSAAAAFDEDEGFFDTSFSTEAADELLQLADDAVFQTPQKARNTGVYATPETITSKKRRILPWEKDSLPIPRPALKGIRGYLETATISPTGSPAVAPQQLGDQEVPAPKTPSKPSPTVSFTVPEVEPTIGTVEAPVTPQKQPAPDETQTVATPVTASRYKDALDNPADSSSSLTSEVMAELDKVSIPAEILTKVRGILTKHDLKTRGITMGRDVVRKSLKARDARIAEMQTKIAYVEAEMEVFKGVANQLRAEQSERNNTA